MAETINTQTTGYECVGIEKIEQTYEGLFDNKPNIITIYLTNGDTHQFKVKNGSQGVGIDRIEQRQTSTTNGGRNEFAIILTNGKEYTFSTYNGSGGSGSSGSFNQVLQHLNNLLMPSGKSYLYYNGSGFEWKSPDGSTGGGTTDLSEYSWWGRKFDPSSKSITGEMSGVTGIEFQSTNGEAVIRKKLYLDKNGDLCFDGNFYATGGITALGSGGGTPGGSGGSTTGTLYVGSPNNNLGFNGSKDMALSFGDGLKVEKSDNQITVSATGGGTGGGIRIKRNGSTLKDSNGDVLSCTSINFKYGENWNSTPILINSDNEISVDLSVVANNGNDSSSSSSYPLTIYNGSSNTDYITYDGSSSAYLKFKSGFSISKVGLGYEISVSGGGSGSSGTTAGKLRFYKDTESDREAYWNGESDFRIIFGSGLNVSWDSTTQITLSATGGSGGSTSTSVSWSDVTNKPSTFTPSSHTHSTNDINGLSNYVQGIKVNNATNADKAKQLANPRLIWGQSFNGTGDINGPLYMGTAGGGSIQLWMNSGNMLDRTGNTLHIGYGLKESSDGEINLDANITKIYTDNYSKHYDFKSNVFDVNSNQIHFGSETNGGRISWDAANKAFKIEGNVYATGGITALGVSNNATTSNNLDFTFKSVTADSATFDKLYLRKEYGYGLFVGTKCALWGAIETDAIHFGGNFTQVYMTEWVVLNSNSKQCYFATRIQSAKGLSLLDGYLDVNYNGTTYKFDFAKAKELGLLINTGVKTLSDEVDYANVIQ